MSERQVEACCEAVAAFALGGGVAASHAALLGEDRDRMRVWHRRDGLREQQLAHLA